MSSGLHVVLCCVVLRRDITLKTCILEVFVNQSINEQNMLNKSLFLLLYSFLLHATNFVFKYSEENTKHGFSLKKKKKNGCIFSFRI